MSPEEAERDRLVRWIEAYAAGRAGGYADGWNAAIDAADRAAAEAARADAAEAEVERLRHHVKAADDARAAVEAECEGLREQANERVLRHERMLDHAEGERLALVAKVARVEAVLAEWERLTRGELRATLQPPIALETAAARVRRALAEPTEDREG